MTLIEQPKSPRAEMSSVLADLVRHIEGQTCTHEETHRGGAIWEICDMCGMQWADDRGGKPEFKWPDCVERARAILAEQGGGGEAVGEVLGGKSNNMLPIEQSEPTDLISALERLAARWVHRAREREAGTFCTVPDLALSGQQMMDAEQLTETLKKFRGESTAVFLGRRENGSPIFEITDISGDEPAIGTKFYSNPQASSDSVRKAVGMLCETMALLCYDGGLRDRDFSFRIEEAVNLLKSTKV